MKLSDVERHQAELLEAKKNRSLVEYYFTLTPAVNLFFLDQFHQVDIITYLDSDLFFLHDPEPLFEELGDNSISIIGHRFSPHLSDWVQFGVYNVGWLSFRSDERGLQCLNWWRERCLEWCYDKPEEGRFADQKYLDDWPDRFPGVKVLKHAGANVAPWNLANSSFSGDHSDLYINGEKVIFFHFHGIRRVIPYVYSSKLHDYGTTLSKPLIRLIYRPYVKSILRTHRQLTRLLPDADVSFGLDSNLRYSDFLGLTLTSSRFPSWLAPIIQSMGQGVLSRLRVYSKAARKRNGLFLVF